MWSRGRKFSHKSSPQMLALCQQTCPLPSQWCHLEAQRVAYRERQVRRARWGLSTSGSWRRRQGAGHETARHRVVTMVTPWRCHCGCSGHCYAWLVHWPVTVTTAGVSSESVLLKVLNFCWNSVEFFYWYSFSFKCSYSELDFISIVAFLLYISY